jgi:endonuclease YncB( thermonuclease family)
VSCHQYANNLATQMKLRQLMWVVFFVALEAPVTAAEVYLARVTYVTDGDTVWVQPEDGSATRKLRLQGIDAPEICQAGGNDARAALRALVLAQQVQVRVRYHDDFGRGLAQIQLGSKDLAATLVSTGHAWSYRWRSKPGPYAAEEALARQARIGLFAAAQPESPRAFRKRHGPCAWARP